VALIFLVEYFFSYGFHKLSVPLLWEEAIHTTSALCPGTIVDGAAPCIFKLNYFKGRC